MQRIKHLGLGLVAALALGALGAGSASAATGFYSEIPSVKISSEPYGTQSLAFPGRAWGDEHECAGSGAEQNGTVNLPGSALTTRGGGGGDWWCTPSGTLDTGSCEFVVHPADANGDATVDIGPPGCGPITISGGYCGFQIPSQTGLNASIKQLAASGKEYLRVTITETGMQYVATGPTPCNPGSYSNGFYNGSIDFKASKSGWGSLDLRNASLGVVSNQIVAPSYPSTVVGGQSDADPLVLGFKDEVFNICDGTEFTSGSLVGPSNPLTLSVTFSDCYLNGIPAPVKMNSCQLELHTSAYYGTIDIACGNPADRIEILAGPCRVYIGEQQGLGMAAFFRTGGGLASGVTGDLHLSGMQYEAVDNFLCPFKGGGTFSDGSYNGTALLTS